MYLIYMIEGSIRSDFGSERRDMPAIPGSAGQLSSGRRASNGITSVACRERYGSWARKHKKRRKYLPI